MMSVAIIYHFHNYVFAWLLKKLKNEKEEII